jgi:hypothetical protein
MSNYGLQPDEGVILKSREVDYRGFKDTPPDEVLLTNKNIIVIVSTGFIKKNRKCLALPH